MDITGTFTDLKTVEYGKHRVAVKTKAWRDGLDMRRVEIEFTPDAGLTPTAYALRWCLPEYTRDAMAASDAAASKEDATSAAPFTRTVKYPCYLEERVYKLTKKFSKSGDDAAVVEVRSVGAAPFKGMCLYHHVEVVRDGGKMRLTVHEVHSVGGNIPPAHVDRFNTEHLPLMCLRLAGLVQPTKPQNNLLLGDICHSADNEKVADTLLSDFARECDDTSFRFHKEVWVKKLNAYVKLYRKSVEGANYDMFRAEYEIDCPEIGDIVTVIEHIPNQGPVKKALTPECEEQGVHLDEATARIAFKVDKIAPWPMQKRQFLLLSLLGWSADGKMMFCQRSIEDKRYPINSGNCLGQFLMVGFRAKPSATPGKVHFMQLIHADPNKIMSSVFEVAMTDKVSNIGHFQDLAATKSKWAVHANGVPLKKK
eukprot:TRINITY_DN719_c3_g3_i1.p1 TRINITY_DN719_c3_g3~~TRINITY_DN719_c3_g3_i1.p1  ORF type:complete len:461 (+),score=186.84 TRINITY_DN719_c3_g3_i1:112-1383(+)